MVGWCDGPAYTSSFPIWMIVGQGPIALAVGAGGGWVEIFTLINLFSSFCRRWPDID